MQRRVERSRGHSARGRWKEGGRRALTDGAVVSVGVRATRLREQAGACGELGRCVESNGRGERERSWAGLSVGFGPGWCGFSFSISIFLFQTLLKPN